MAVCAANGQRKENEMEGEGRAERGGAGWDEVDGEKG